MEIRPHPDITEVLLVEGKPFFPISWLHKQAYCEYQIFLENMKGIAVAKTQSMVIGSKRHEELDSQHKEQATEEMTMEDALEKSKSEGISISARECRVFGFRSQIRGSIDEVVITPERVEIIDDKPGDIAYNSSIKQVRGYCLAFKEHYNLELPIFGAIRNRDSQKVIWNEEFTENAEREVLESINRIHDLISGKREFEPTRNPQKCRSCRFLREGKCDKAAM